jgi:hypothetical protein
MIEPLTGLPEGVIGFEVKGEVHGDDYRTVLIPAIEEQLGAGDDLRIVLVYERWDGFSAGAAWEDMKMGIEHFSHWKRIAVVTDLDWMVHAMQLFGWMSPGEVKRFALAERDAAIAWAAGS